MHSNKLLRRVLSLALVFCMLLTAVPAAVAAADGQYRDVDTGSWAYPYIQDVTARGLFNGTGADRFSPNGTMTRAMLATVLARMAGVSPDNGEDAGFTDVPAGTWYTGSVAWAAGCGVIQGMGDGTFRPMAPVTREQAATMLYRYAASADLVLPATAEKAEFTDGAKIHGWAAAAVQALQLAEILNGYPDGSFRPARSITRAEAAKILSVFLAVARPEEAPPEPTDDTTEPSAPTEPSTPSDPTVPVEPTVPTEPAEPITVTFTGERCTVLVGGEPTTRVTLEAGVDYLEFSLFVEDGYEIYDITASTGTLANLGSNYVLGGLTGDTAVAVTTGLVKHTVTFDPCNGEAPAAVKVVHGETVQQPRDPEKTEDVFQGWHTAAGDAWDFTAPVLADMTLYAYWLNDSYVDAVLYLDGVNGSDLNDGLTPETAVKTFAKAQALMPAKVRGGVIYIVNTVTVTEAETWDMGGKDCVVKRWSECLTDMIDVPSGSLTLSNITIDGNRDNIDLELLDKAALGHCLYVSASGELTIHDGTVIQNNYHIKGQGGALYIYQGGKVTMNGGKLLNNEAGFTGGAIGISGSSKPELSCTFIMNGGEISGNFSGSLGGAIAGASGYMYIELNGGVISGNTTKSVTSAAVYHGSKYGHLKLSGVTVRDNLYADGTPSAGVYTSYSTGVISPTGATALEDRLVVNNSNTTSGKLNYYLTDTGLANLSTPLPIQLKNLYVGAVVLAGTGDCTLTEADVAKIALVNDIEGAYFLNLDPELNQIVLAEVPNHDIVVYLNGVAGKDTNDGLTVKTPVKTFERAKELLHERVNAAENIPEDAGFVISLVNKVTVTEDMTLTFADFGEQADRCMLRRDASFSSGQMFSLDGAAVVLEDFVIDGNLPFVKNNSGAMFSMNNGARVTVNDGTVIRNYKSTGMGGLFYLSSSKQNGDTVLTFNGGHIYNVEGGSGAVAILWGSTVSGAYHSKCVVNDLLLEDSVCSTGMFYLYAGCTMELNGGTFRNNTATSAGSVAAVRDGKTCQLLLNSPAEGKTMRLEGDIYLYNASYDEDGNATPVPDCLVYITGPLKTDLSISATLAFRKIAVAQGFGYTLTEADLARTSMTSGDALTLNTAANQFVITKTMN